MALGFFWASVSLAVFLSALILDKMGILSRKNHFPVEGRVTRPSSRPPPPPPLLLS